MANEIANTPPSKLRSLSDAELDKITGGRMMDMYSKMIQAKNDMQKGIIANFRV